MDDIARLILNIVTTLLAVLLVCLTAFIVGFKLWLKKEKRRIMKEFNLTSEEFERQLDQFIEDGRR